MSREHPFQQLFGTLGKLPAAHAESVNRDAREMLEDCLSESGEKSGRCILLKAPRAGHGKTHMLAMLVHRFGATHEFIPIRAVGGSRIDAVSVLEDTLRRLVRPLPSAGGLTFLDHMARLLFSRSLQPLVTTGEVPSQDRELALKSLRNRPIETFDFHNPSAATALWARENFELLGPRFALGLSQAHGLPLREVSFWVEALFRFSSTRIDDPSRISGLSETVFGNGPAESTSHERLAALLGLMGSMMRVVIVADELEGFSTDGAEALKFASLLGSLRQAVERLDVIISVNEDIWQSTFLPRLSGGLTDRLTEITIELRPLDRDGMLAIIESRSPGMGERILGKLGGYSLPTYARGIIKKAGENWGGQSENEANPGATATSSSLVPGGDSTKPIDTHHPDGTENVPGGALSPIESAKTTVSQANTDAPTAMEPDKDLAKQSSTDRVDGLLKQFRERYGKPQG